MKTRCVCGCQGTSHHIVLMPSCGCSPNYYSPLTSRPGQSPMPDIVCPIAANAKVERMGTLHHNGPKVNCLITVGRYMLVYCCGTLDLSTPTTRRHQSHQPIGVSYAFSPRYRPNVSTQSNTPLPLKVGLGPKVPSTLGLALTLHPLDCRQLPLPLKLVKRSGMPDCRHQGSGSLRREKRIGREAHLFAIIQILQTCNNNYLQSTIYKACRQGTPCQ